MTENMARMATRRRACAAFDGQKRDDRDGTGTDALSRAHAITAGLQTAQ